MTSKLSEGVCVWLSFMKEERRVLELAPFALRFSEQILTDAPGLLGCLFSFLPGSFFKWFVPNSAPL